MKKRIDVPETVSDEQWDRLQRAAAKEIPLIDDPWVDPGAAAKKRHFLAARDYAAEN